MPIFEGGLSLDQFDSANSISVQTESALRIFRNAAVANTDPHARALGLYSDVSLGRDLKGRMMSLTTPRHLLSSRKNGCSWNPKGKLRTETNEFNTCAVEYNGEQCPDVFYGTCFERLFAPGKGVRDFASTEEGQALLAELLRRIYIGLGNSFFDLYNFANHPLITAANSESFYKVSVDEWVDYLDQQTSGDCGGLLTIIDELAGIGTKGYDLDIPNTSINETTGKFTGNIVNLIEDVKAAAPALLAEAIENGIQLADGRIVYPIVLMTAPEFTAYKDYIRSMAGTNELAYRYMVTGADGVTAMNRNVLMYDEMPVVRWDANSAFDAVVGTQSHRVAIVIPGMFGVLHDVQDLMQWDGLGLRIEQSTRIADKGKVFMDSTFRWGAGLANKDGMAMASNILHP